ncbi:hypothetical protein Bbelb_350860 [Branchiostoma belcheri]|nr:hypothetical protein Bbelb_350860 [Branchiostoma belcheri]
MFPGVEINKNNDRAREQTINVVAAVVQNLRDWFPETQLITAFRIIDPKNMSQDQYGTEELNILLATYGGVPAYQPLTVDLSIRARSGACVALTIDSLWEELERVHGT